MADRHGPNRLDNYIQTHETIMGQFVVQGVVETESLDFIEGAAGHIILDGEIYLRESLLKITVTKELGVTMSASGDLLVQTKSYSYNVSIVGESNVFRYCSPHLDTPNVPHHPHHHRHQYDPFGKDLLSNTVSTQEDGDWPLLGDVISEAETWYWDHKDELKALIANVE